MQLLQGGKHELSQGPANAVGDLDKDRFSSFQAVNLAFLFWLLILEQGIFLAPVTMIKFKHWS